MGWGCLFDDQPHPLSGFSLSLTHTQPRRQHVDGLSGITPLLCYYSSILYLDCRSILYYPVLWHVYLEPLGRARASHRQVWARKESP